MSAAERSADAAAWPPDSILARLVPGDPATAVRPLGPDDTAFCRALFDEDRGPRFASLGDAALVRTLLDQQFHAQQVGYARNYPRAEHGVIEHAGVAVGRLIVNVACGALSAGASDGIAVAPPALAGPVVHLVDIVLAEAARRHGIGADVIDSVARAARACGLSRMTLSVSPANNRARRLYARLGFAGTPAGSHIAMARPLT